MVALNENFIESFGTSRWPVSPPSVPNIPEAIADAFEPQAKSLELMAQEAKRQADALEEQVRQAKLDADDANREAKRATVRAWVAIGISVISLGLQVLRWLGLM